MRFISLLAQLRWFSFALLLVCGAEAFGADIYSAGRLTIPTLVIGNATYSNVVVTVASIISGPAGSAAIGTVDSYNPANQQLTAQTVALGSITLYNVVITVSSLVSVGSVSGADSYNGSTISALIVKSDYSLLSYATFRPTGAPTIAGGLPTALYDSFAGGTLTIPAVTYAGRVFTNVSVPATEESAGSTNQTISFSKPLDSLTPLPIGSSEAILATATSGLPVSYVVSTPTTCMIAQSSAHQGYGYIQYSAAGGSGSGVVGATALGGGAFQADSFTGTTSTGAPLGLAMASPVLDLLPATDPNYLPPYPNFVLDAGTWFFDDVLFANGGALLDADGIALSTAGDPVINLYFVAGSGYQYNDSILFAGNPTGQGQPMTMSATIVSGLVGLADGACAVTAFQPGNGAFTAAAPTTITVDVGEIILP